MVSEWQGVDGWLELLRRYRSEDEVLVATQVIAWADERQLKHRGQGKDADTKGVIYMPVIPGIDWDPVPFHVKSKLGRVGLEGGSIGSPSHRPYGAPGSLERLVARLRTIDGVALEKDTYPDIALSDLADDRFDAFFVIMDDVIRQVRRANL